MTISQICSVCRQTKPIDDFHKSRCEKTGHHGQCAKCRSEREKEKRKDQMYRLRANDHNRVWRLGRGPRKPRKITDETKADAAMVEEWQEAGHIPTSNWGDQFGS